MPREMAGHVLHPGRTERFPCAISAILPTWAWPPSTWAGGFGEARPPPGRGIAAGPHGARGSQRGHVQARDDLVAAAAARRFVRDTLRTWQVVGRSASQDELVDDAVLLTSELVTNAVVHAGTPVQVTCRLAHGAVEVVVLDRHPVQLVPDREPRDSSGAERTSGRGLMLPSELASSWGVTYARTAKAVWFRLGIADFDAADEAGMPDGPDRAAGAAPRSGASGMLTAAGTVGEGQPAGPDGGPARDRPAGNAQLADGEWPAGS